MPLTYRYPVYIRAAMMRHRDQIPELEIALDLQQLRAEMDLLWQDAMRCRVAFRNHKQKIDYVRYVTRMNAIEEGKVLEAFLEALLEKKRPTEHEEMEQWRRGELTTR